MFLEHEDGDHARSPVFVESMVLDFPVVVNAEVTIPDQTKVISGFKSRMKKMQAAHIDSRGGRMINVDAAVAHSQLNDVLTAVISSFASKSAVFRLIVTIRTSKPVVSRSDLEEAQGDRCRERVIHAVGRMNGAYLGRWPNAGCFYPARPDGRAQPARDERTRPRCTRRICCPLRHPGSARCNRRSSCLKHLTAS